MIDGRLVDVFVPDRVAGPDDEGRPELEHTLPGHVDLVPAPPGADRCAVGLRAEHVPCAAALHAGGPRRDGIVVDEYGERDALLLDEVARVACVTGSDRDDLGSGGEDLCTGVAQLRCVLAAVQSPEVAQEDENDRSVCPVIAETMLLAIRAGEGRSRKSPEIHRGAG